jgi:hypothetical protein
VAKINAHGGAWVVGDSEGALNRVETAEYEIDVEELIDDTTDSGSTGVSEGLPCLQKVQSLTMTVSEDDTSYPEVLGLTPGAVVTIFCRRGALNQWDMVFETIVKGYRKVNDNNGKARKVSVTCEYGRYQHAVSAPLGFN